MRLWFTRHWSEVSKRVARRQSGRDLISKDCADVNQANDKHTTLVGIPPPFVGVYSYVEGPPTPHLVDSSELKEVIDAAVVRRTANPGLTVLSRKAANTLGMERLEPGRQ